VEKAVVWSTLARFVNEVAAMNFWCHKRREFLTGWAIRGIQGLLFMQFITLLVYGWHHYLNCVGSVITSCSYLFSCTLFLEPQEEYSVFYGNKPGAHLIRVSVGSGGYMYTVMAGIWSDNVFCFLQSVHANAKDVHCRPCTVLSRCFACSYPFITHSILHSLYSWNSVANWYWPQATTNLVEWTLFINFSL
jgi:hypothetical protein